MAFPLRSFYRSFVLDSVINQTPSTSKCNGFHILCNSPSSHLSGAEDSLYPRENAGEHPILIEKYSNGSSKRYIVENEWKIRTILEEHPGGGGVFTESGNFETDIGYSWLPKVVRDFILPAGFPDSVSDDYLGYMLLQFPTNVTGWICHTLVTSSLLQAVGFGSVSGAKVAASAATIRWVSKDGIGAVGRLFIGGKFGNLFDDDPKQWRLYADFIGSAGSIFDLSTPLYPAYFLPLASLGNLAKAIGRGLRDPSFRVIQNHFATSGNLGEVSAKEEVWEVTAELVGLALGILILDTPYISSSYPLVASTCLTIRLFHLWFRYLSLSVLQFNTINLKRARILANEDIIHQKIPGIRDCNRMENILVWEKFLKPKISFGVPLEELLNVNNSGSVVRMLVKLYADEKYFLMVNQSQTDFEVFVSFKEGATSYSMLRSIWQSYWLRHHWKRFENASDQLEESLRELKDNFDAFLSRVEEAGWQTDQIFIKVPKLIFDLE